MSKFLAGLVVAAAVTHAHLAAYAEPFEPVYQAEGAGLVAALPSGELIGEEAGSTANGEVDKFFVLSPPGQGQDAWTKTVVFETSPESKRIKYITPILAENVNEIYAFSSNGGGVYLDLVRLGPAKNSDGRLVATTLASFTGLAIPGSLTMDRQGALYAVAQYGGASYCNYGGDNPGCGVIYRLTPPPAGSGKWMTEVIYQFQSGEGTTPNYGLVASSDGSFFGSTTSGGLYNNGTAFHLIPPPSGQTTWQLKTIHNFQCGDAGGGQPGTVTLGPNGQLFGAMICNINETATVFSLMPPASEKSLWSYTRLYRFARGFGFNTPIVVSKGRIVGGVTEQCSLTNCGGRILELDEPTAPGEWQAHVLHTFKGGLGYAFANDLVATPAFPGQVFGSTARAGQAPRPTDLIFGLQTGP